MRILLSIFLFLSVVGQSFANDLVLQPTDLEPGDQYRLLFTTSAVRDATSSDIDDYNDFVQSVADAAPVVGSWGIEWRAVAQTRRVSGRDNTGIQPDDPLPTYRIDGVQIAGNGETFWDVSNFTPWTTTEIGTLVEGFDPELGENGGIPIFTGTTNGRIFFLDSHLGDDRVFVGNALGDTILKYGFDTLPATDTTHFYAVSTVLTAVPEPASKYFAIWLVGLLLLRNHRKKSIVA